MRGEGPQDVAGPVSTPKTLRSYQQQACAPSTFGAELKHAALGMEDGHHPEIYLDRDGEAQRKVVDLI